MTTTKLTIVAMLVLAFGMAAAGKPAETVRTLEQPAREEVKQVRLDRHGDPLPEGALLRLGTLRFRAKEWVGNVVFSPNEQIVASGGYQGTIQFWEATTGKEIRQMQAATHTIPSIAFSPDGKRLASTGNKVIQLWDVSTGKELSKITADVPLSSSNGVVPIVFSPDGTALASVAADHSLRVWNVTTGKERLKLTGHKIKVNCLVFSDDSKTLFSASGDGLGGDELRAWEITAGKEVNKGALREKKDQAVYPLGFSPDGKTIALSVQARDKHCVHFFDVAA